MGSSTFQAEVCSYHLSETRFTKMKNRASIFFVRLQPPSSPAAPRVQYPLDPHLLLTRRVKDENRGDSHVTVTVYPTRY